MSPVSQNDIDSMKERGYDPATIRDAESRRQLFERGQIIALQIQEAFADVTLGSGIGLAESGGLDEREPADILARYRAVDEKEDWARIPLSALNSSSGGLAFFDAEGMRFHLPAYLIADLRGEYFFGMAFPLTHLSDHCIAQFACLNVEQRKCVRAYLLLILEDPDYEFYRDSIQNSLDGYWSDTRDATTPPA
jgi:hypothetical protein